MIFMPRDTLQIPAKTRASASVSDHKAGEGRELVSGQKDGIIRPNSNVTMPSKGALDNASSRACQASWLR